MQSDDFGRVPCRLLCPMIWPAWWSWSFRKKGSMQRVPNRKKHWTDWFGRRVPAARLSPIFSAANETVSRQAGGRAAVGGAGEFSVHPARRRTNRELEGRAHLVGPQVQRRGEGGADPHL